ncbi:MAG: PepSY domain-containing protein [Pseudomonadota bacterium]|nr:PepSY domain-containing protein [Pseudomonadota bacterium]
MKSLRTPVVAAVLALSTVCVFAQHAERCDPIPKTEWRTRADLEKKLKNEGWTINRVKIENGCYEVYGKDAKGKKMETFFHPKTLDVVTAPK